ncbi:MAG TPA: CYTH domain-containing protein [Dehalococcoidia bacterium]|nr:CYTH domain-containing protein [Dehalococcoidia bacterium]
MLEIERQFLVKPALLPALGEPHRIVQAYLCIEPEVRVRLIDGRAYLTVKSEGDIARQEFEYEVPTVEAEAMVRLSPFAPVEKLRYRLQIGGLVWEIDRYTGENEGLWSAEVELTEAAQAIDLPEWLAEEVTYEPRFKNKNLARQPFCRWPDREAVLAKLR